MGPEDVDSKDKSLGPIHLSGLFRKTRVFQFEDLYSTQKRISWQERAINPSGGSGAPTTRPGHRQRLQGTALSSGLSVWPRTTCPRGSQNWAEAEGGQRLSFQAGPSRPGGAASHGGGAFQSAPGCCNRSGASSPGLPAPPP